METSVLISDKTRIFLDKLNKSGVHKDKCYDYSLVDYINNKTKVKIICKEHGIFEQRPSDHLRGVGCAKCSGNIKKTTEEFIKEAVKKHGNLYDYSLVNYTRSDSKVKIICKEHGIFEQIAKVHLKSQGCFDCFGSKLKTTNEFIKEAKLIHKNKNYDYSKVIYKGNKIKVEIICKEHGSFHIKPINHLQKQGCAKCIGRYMTMENTKICFSCKVEKDHSLFYKRTYLKSGIGTNCKECMKKINLENRDTRKKRWKIYFEKNKEILNIKTKIYYNENKRIISERRKYHNVDKELKKIYNKEYRLNNKEILNIKKNIRYKQRIKENPIFALRVLVKNSIQKCFYNNGYTKKSRTQEILGCSFEEFLIHIESQMDDWMNWENRGKYNGELNHGWDLDHIIPISSAKTEEDIIRLNHYTNLQPLCSKINRDIKKDRLEY